MKAWDMQIGQVGVIERSPVASLVGCAVRRKKNRLMLMAEPKRVWTAGTGLGLEVAALKFDL